MPELRRLAADLINRPVVSTPALDAVQARATRYRQRRVTQLSAAAVALMLVVGLVGVGVIDGGGAESRVTFADDGLPVDPSTITLPTVPGGGVPGVGSTTTTSSTSTTVPPTTTTTVRGGIPPNEDACPGGQNAGATDVGVTADKVTVLVTSSSMLGARAYANVVNQQGGVCGRRLDVAVTSAPAFVTVPDVFGSPGSASMPAVGAEGMALADAQSAWTWGVGTSAAAQARIMVQHAWDGGARTFAVVYDNARAFGTQGADAFKQHVQRLGGTLVTQAGINPGQASYAAAANAFNSACSGGKCDMVGWFVATETARSWLQANGAMGRTHTAAIHLLMSDRFAQDCVVIRGDECDGLAIWNPYNAPIGPLASDPDVRQYVEHVRGMDPGADVNSAVLERSYVGMRVLVEGLRDVGANLTRERLQASLNRLSFRSGLTSPLSWTPNRQANRSARPFELVVVQGSFSGYRFDTGFRSDPAP